MTLAWQLLDERGTSPAPVTFADREGKWLAHDRTHLQLIWRCPREAEDGAQVEIFYFVPRSLRIEETHYRKRTFHADLTSYLRLAPRPLDFSALDETLAELESMLSDASEPKLLDSLALVAFRTREASAALGRLSDAERVAAADDWLTAAPRLTRAMRQLIRKRRHSMTETNRDATLRWAHDDVSLVVENTLCMLSCSGTDPRFEARRRRFAKAAAREARERRAIGGVTAHIDMTESEAEHFEFVRHNLKRFTSSPLWLNCELVKPPRWPLHLAYALAAGTAMAFAVAAALWNGAPESRSETLAWWLLVAIIAYAVKDRIKATLQQRLEHVIKRRFPDRRWKVMNRDGDTVAHVDEESGFCEFDEVPADVLACRRMTRKHAIEELARPETVLWHRRRVELGKPQLGEKHEGLAEILRLDLGRWLTHTSDPDNRVLFADPDRGVVAAANAPRVYNIAVVYRIRVGDEDAAWSRARIVVSREGIRRIEAIHQAGPSSGAVPQES